MTAPPSDPHRVAIDRLRWRPPRSWAQPAVDASWPTALLGQEDLRAELALLLATRGHLVVAVPESVDWAEAVGRALRSLQGDGDAPVVVAAPATARSLRGTDGPGQLAQAHGGFLVLDARDLVGNEGAWAALSEGLRARQSTPESESGLASPQPTRFATVLLSPESALSKLKEQEPLITALFRRGLTVAGDRPRTREGAMALLGQLAARGGLDGVPANAAGWLLEEAATSVRRDRLALDTDALREIVFEARLGRPAGALERRHLRAAAARIAERRGFGEQAHRGRLERGQIRVATEGALVGVVNGLMVYGGTKQPYAVPGRITARTAVGREGIVNVEREAKFSGRSYDKGVLQLHSFLRGTFAQDTPLSLVAGITFEQSYGKVDGDSATLAKALAVLSDLSDLPVRQSLAITGGINPRGEVLPVGSVTLKAVGWWRTCRDRGLTGEQGFVLPSRSTPDLQLPEELLSDVRAGRFAVWEVDHIDEAVQLMFGKPAGRQDKGFAPGSVYAAVGRRLDEMGARLYPKRAATKEPGKEPAKTTKKAKTAPKAAAPGDTPKS